MRVPGYPAPIPRVLVTLREYIHTHGGLETPGLFKSTGASTAETDHVKEAINEDKFEVRSRRFVCSLLWVLVCPALLSIFVVYTSCPFRRLV